MYMCQYIHIYTYISTTDLYIAWPHRCVRHIQKLFVNMQKLKNQQIRNEPPNAQGVAPSKKDVPTYSQKRLIYIHRFVSFDMMICLFYQKRHACSGKVKRDIYTAAKWKRTYLYLEKEFLAGCGQIKKIIFACNQTYLSSKETYLYERHISIWKETCLHEKRHQWNKTHTIDLYRYVTFVKRELCCQKRLGYVKDIIHNNPV